MNDSNYKQAKRERESERARGRGERETICVCVLQGDLARILAPWVLHAGPSAYTINQTNKNGQTAVQVNYTVLTGINLDLMLSRYGVGPDLLEIISTALHESVLH